MFGDLPIHGVRRKYINPTTAWVHQFGRTNVFRFSTRLAQPVQSEMQLKFQRFDDLTTEPRTHSL